MNEQPHGSQFSRNRMLLIAGIAVVTAAAIWWLVENRPPMRAVPPPSSEAWEPYTGLAIFSVLIVVVIDVIALVITARKRRMLPEHEKDWKGPDPHLDRMIPVQAYSPSPVMQRALRRTMSKQSS